MSFSRLARAFQRKFTTSAIRASAEGPSATSGHSGGMKLWRLLSFTVAVPGVAVCMINAYIKELEHMAHPHRPDFVPHEYMRIRTHKFPWGDGNHTLFHNPKLNALPDGYEVDLEVPDHHH